MNINDMRPCPRCAGAPGKDPTKTGGPVPLPDDPAAPGEKHFAFDTRCELCGGSGYIPKGSTMITLTKAGTPIARGLVVTYLTIAVPAKADESPPLGAGIAITGQLTSFDSSASVALHTVYMPNMMADEPIKLDPAPPAWWRKVVKE